MNTKIVAEAGLSPQRIVEEGSEAIIHLAASRELEAASGRFFDGVTSPARTRRRTMRASVNDSESRARTDWVNRWRHPLKNPSLRPESDSTDGTFHRRNQVGSSILPYRADPASSP